MANIMWEEVRTAKAENRHELVLSGAEIAKRIEDQELDENVYTLVEINFLEMSKIGLQSLSEDLGNLSNLTNLVLHTNNIKVLPSSFGKLKKLKMLDVSRNCLEEIPDDIKLLTQLDTLNLSNNKLQTLPSLANNTKLVNVDVSHNLLEEFLDICYPELIQLADVRLNNNKIQEVPLTVTKLPALKCLDLGENALKTVPGEVGDCVKLKELNLKGNKLSDRRLFKLVDQCHSKQVLDYVRQHCPRSQVTGDTGGGGKGKKGKKGKHGAAANQENDAVDTISDELKVLHVSDDTPSVIITEAVKEVRPYIVCCIVRNIHLSETAYKAFIQLQTKLHDTVCDKRNAATIATHDLAKIQPGPLKYHAQPPTSIKIRPLGRPAEVTGGHLFTQLQREAEALRKEKKRNVYSGIHKFLYLLEKKSVYPALFDSQGQVISFPPITNSDVTKISVDTKDLFVEVTSSVSLPVCKSVMDTLLLETMKLGIGDPQDSAPQSFLDSYHSLVVEQVKVVDGEGSMKVVYPSRADLVFENQRVKIVRE